MKFFIDSGDIGEIKEAWAMGAIDGVTTNPTLYGKVGGSYDDILRQICDLTPGPVSAEVVARVWVAAKGRAVGVVVVVLIRLQLIEAAASKR